MQMRAYRQSVVSKPVKQKQKLETAETERRKSTHCTENAYRADVQKRKSCVEQDLKTKILREQAREQNGCGESTPDRTDERHESHSGRNEVVRSAPGREDRKWICRGRSPIRRGYAAVKTAQKQRKGSDDNAL